MRRGNQTRPNIRWRCTLALYLVKTTERSVHGGDAALCQTTLTTCLISTSDIYTLNKKNNCTIMQLLRRFIFHSPEGSSGHSQPRSYNCIAGQGDLTELVVI